MWLRCLGLGALIGLLHMSGLGPAVAESGARIGLVIGNVRYADPRTNLAIAEEDAGQVATGLERAGFTVVRRQDLGRSAILASVTDLAASLQSAGPDAVGFIYFSGHGAGVKIGGRRLAYLLPSDALARNAEEVQAAAVSLDDIVDLLDDRGARAVFIVIDACLQDRTFSQNNASDIAPPPVMEVRPGVLVLLTGGHEGGTTHDGQFASSLADALAIPGLSHTDVLARAWAGVVEASGRSLAVDVRSGVSGSVVLHEPDTVAR